VGSQAVHAFRAAVEDESCNGLRGPRVPESVDYAVRAVYADGAADVAENRVGLTFIDFQ